MRSQNPGGCIGGVGRGCGSFTAALAAVLFGVAVLFAVPASAGPATEPAAGATGTEPTSVISTFDSALLSAMKKGKPAGIDGRAEIMRPAVAAAFDLRRISQVVLGSYWNNLTMDQRDQFADLLRVLIVTSYSANFDSYSGQKFEITGSARHESSAFVSTRFVNPNTGKVHAFDYVLESASGRWGIVNVIADGVSDVAVKRAEYSAVLEKGTFGDLVKALEKQIAKARSGS